MPKRDAEPTQPAFVPIEHTPIQDHPDIAVAEWVPIEVATFVSSAVDESDEKPAPKAKSRRSRAPRVPAAPVAEHNEPATGDTEGN